MLTTRLSHKLRVLAKTQPKRAVRLNAEADKLDRAMYTGTVNRETSLTYRNARLAYCQASGRAWDWGAETDLQMVERNVG